MSSDHALKLSISELSQLESPQLHEFLEEAEDELSDAKKLVSKIKSAIVTKYAARIELLREKLQKESGVVRLDDGKHSIKADIPKNISWDQHKLKEIASRIQEAGEDPTEYIEITYKVSERKYKEWPSHLKASFEPARTLNYGKQTIEMNPSKERK